MKININMLPMKAKDMDMDIDIDEEGNLESGTASKHVVPHYEKPQRYSRMHHQSVKEDGDYDDD